jgi:hypothetical protein
VGCLDGVLLKGQQSPQHVVEQFMEQSMLNVQPASQIAHEQVEGFFMNRAGRFVCLSCIRQDPYGGLPDPNRGLVRKLIDALSNFVRYGRFDDGSFAARLRD